MLLLTVCRHTTHHPLLCITGGILPSLVINWLHVFQYVKEEDLEGIGMTRPEMRRLKKFYKKEHPQGTFGKLKRVSLNFLFHHWNCLQTLYIYMQHSFSCGKRQKTLQIILCCFIIWWYFFAFSYLLRMHLVAQSIKCFSFQHWELTSDLRSKTSLLGFTTHNFSQLLLWHTPTFEKTLWSF